MRVFNSICGLCVFCMIVSLSLAATNSCKFKRGDGNGDSSVDISDVSYILAYAFQGGPAPPNLDAADVNDDGGVDTSDVSYLMAFLFSGGAAPPAPGPYTPDCDPTTSDDLEICCTPELSDFVIDSTLVIATSLSPGVLPWDCNLSFASATDVCKVSLRSFNDETTVAACTGNEPTDLLTNTPCCARTPSDACGSGPRVTHWFVGYILADAPPVERHAFPPNGCTQLNLRLSWTGLVDFPLSNVSSCLYPPCGRSMHISIRPESDVVLSWEEVDTGETIDVSVVDFLDESHEVYHTIQEIQQGELCMLNNLGPPVPVWEQAGNVLPDLPVTGCWKLIGVTPVFRTNFYPLTGELSDVERIRESSGPSGYSVCMVELGYKEG